MKKSLLAAILSVPLAGSLAFAQDTPPAEEGAPMEEMGTDKKMSLGADGAFVIPLGNFGDAAGMGLGALLKFGYMVNEQIMATARAGFIYHLAKDVAGSDWKYNQIPIMLGGKYMFGAAYGAVELGLVRLGVDAGGATDSEMNLAMGLGAGYMMGDLDLRLSFNMIDLGHAGDSQEIMLNVGYDFAHF